MQLPFTIYPGSAQKTHWIFAFCGYGQPAYTFEPLAQLCRPRYGFIVFELPGGPESLSFTKEDLAAQLEQILKKEGIEKITGISYSAGCRYNLLLAEFFAEKIKHLFLVAPDGIKINLWNRLSTSTIVGQQLFKYLMTHPRTYLKLLQLIYGMRLVSKSVYAFAKWHTRNKENSIKVYHTWMNMKYMLPDLEKINTHKIKFDFPLYAYFGMTDEVIGGSVLRRLKNKIPSAIIVELNKGHNLLDDNLFHDIASLLL